MTTDVINGVPRDWLKQLHRDLDACQKLIWANLRGCDPAYCADAQARLAEIETMLATAQPAADGEREVWAVPVLDGEKKTTFYTEQLPFVPGIGVKQLGEPVRMVEARAAQPQQTVAVTDEVLTGIASVHHQMGMVCLTYKHSAQTQAAVKAFRAALAAHKTGE